MLFSGNLSDVVLFAKKNSLISFLSSNFCVIILFWRPEANLKGKTLRSNQNMVWKHGSILKIKTESYISSFQQRNKSFAQTTIFLFFSVIFAFHHKTHVFNIFVPFFDEAWNCSTDEVSRNGAWSGGLCQPNCM